MKLLKALLFICASSGFNSVHGQIVTFEPAFPTENDSIRVIFNATEGAGGLKDFDGDVYLHTGVITNESTSGTDWKYVPYDWTTNNDRVKATYLGNNKWAYTYLPDIRTFFGITDPNVTVEKVAIVYKGVKNGTVVAEGKDTGNTDIFISMTGGGASARFVQPLDPFAIMDSDSSLEITGMGTVLSGDTELILLKNGVEVHSVLNDSITYNFTPEATELDVNFDLIATNGTDLSDTASVFVTVKENNGDLINRPTGLQDGITYSGSTVKVSLFAPNKEYVYLIGDFNDWQPTSGYLLNKEVSGDDSTWFWLDVDGLVPGTEYAFQYLIDGEIRIADPYSELVLDAYNDKYIPESTFPNLKEYPVGKTSGLVSVIKPGEDEYEWQVTNFIRPEKEELVIYELLLRDFLETSNYSTLTDTLDYIENLGINAIELMPVNEFDGNLSWGYNPALHLALDKYYGTADAFKAFVDEAHSRGIAVIVDLVLNHATGQNPLYRLYDHGDNPYFNAEARHAYNVFNDFNHQYSGTQYYVKRTVQYWIQEYNIDGFRWDLTKGFTQNCTADDQGCTGSPQPDRINVLKKYADYQWEVDPEFYVIFEHLGSESEESQWANYRVHEGKGVLLWGNMNYAYNEATMGYNNNSDLTAVLAESRSTFVDRHLIGYMESHDEERLMYKNIQYGASFGDYNTSDLNIALNRMQLAAAFFLTLPGPKMIWQFGELGYDVHIDFNGRTGEKPIRWNYFDDPLRQKLYKTYQALLSLRHASPAFTAPESLVHKLTGAFKWVKLQHTDTDVVIAGNFGLSEDSLQITFPTAGTWYNYFDGTEVQIQSTDTTITLSAGTFIILSTKAFEQPEEGILTDMDTDKGAIPLSFRLHQNYPNPFNPSTVISYQLSVNTKVKLDVFDLVGRKVATLVDDRLPAGNHEVVYHAQNLASGVYIYRLTANDNVLTQKMTLIK